MPAERFTGLRDPPQAECHDCRRFGIRVAFEQVSDQRALLRVEAADFATLLAHRDELNRGSLPVTVVLEEKDISESDAITLYPYISAED